MFPPNHRFDMSPFATKIVIPANPPVLVKAIAPLLTAICNIPVYRHQRLTQNHLLNFGDS